MTNGRSPSVRRLQLAVLALLTFGSTLAGATPARVQALQGMPLFEDDTDLFTMPALTARYGRAASLHIGAGGPMAGFIHGREGGWQLGVFHNSTVAYDDLARTAANLGVTVLQPPRILSFFAGKPLDDERSIGFALNTSLGFQRSVPLNGGLSYQLAFDVEGIFGYSSRYGTRHSDSAVALSYHRFIRYADPNRTADTPVGPSIALRHRTIWLGEDGVDFGIYGEAARREEGLVQSAPTPTRAVLARYFVNGGLGPRIRIADIAMISPSVELVVNTVGGRVDNAGTGVTTVTAPGLRAAAEVYPFPWLALRAGVSKAYNLQLSRPQNGDQADALAAGFNWSTGLGVRKGGFEADATISNAFLLNGPAFVGGGAPGLFGSLSMRYHY
jgi:hypothetical protein